MPSSTLADVRQRALAAGFDLFGVVDAQRFDACQPRDQRLSSLLPRCGTAILIGNGGPQQQPQVAKLGIRLLVELLRGARLRVCLVEPGRGTLSFARLADAAGFGTVSPVTGLLLHPEFGPWVRIHAALLVVGQPFGTVDDASVSDQFQPCCKCRQPCLEPVSEPADACPVGSEHRSGSLAPVPIPAPVSVSRASRLADSAMRWMPRLFRRQ